MDRLIQTILNAVMRQVINRGVKTGIDRLSGGDKTRGLADSPQSRDLARKARQAANLARKLGR